MPGRTTGSGKVLGRFRAGSGQGFKEVEVRGQVLGHSSATGFGKVLGKVPRRSRWVPGGVQARF